MTAAAAAVAWHYRKPLAALIVVLSIVKLKSFASTYGLNHEKSGCVPDMTDQIPPRSATPFYPEI